MKTIEARSGLVPYVIKDYQIYFLCMVPSDPKYGTSSPQIAKGKIDEGESPTEAAVREAREELGIKEELLDDITFLGDFHILGKNFQYNLSVYYAKYGNYNELNEPVYETKEVLWMTNELFQEKGRYIHKDIMQKIFELVNR